MPPDRTPAGCLLVATLALWSPLAQAHSSVDIGAFYQGALELVLHWEQALFLVAAGMWCAQQPVEERPTSGGVVVFGLAAGAVFVFVQQHVSEPMLWSAMGYTFAGLAVAGRLQARWFWPLGVAAVAAFASGFGFGAAAIGELGRPVLFACGMVIGAALLLFYLTLAAASLPAGWPQIALRVLGSWIAATGVMVCAFVVHGMA